MSEIDFKIGDFITTQQVDLTNCDREAIHIPGFIQPHGLLFVLKEPELTIVQLSNNTLALLNLPPELLLNQHLTNLFEAEQVEYLRAALLEDNFTSNPLHLFTIIPKNQNHPFNVIIHRHEGLLFLELEPVISVSNSNSPLAAPKPTPNAYNLVKLALSKINQSMSLADFSQLIAEQVQLLTGFDRVMVYRFSEEDGSGTVIAEAKHSDIGSFLGLHYPASDIPKQARALYLLNWLRLIADVKYQPSQVIPTVNPLTGRSLDMSYAVLRSVSPIHIEYLKNMGVGASMSISIISENKLWGLLACHHNSAKYIPYDLRTACEFLGQVISLQLIGKQEYEDRDYELKLKTTHARFVELMSNEKGFVEGLLNHEPNLLNFIEAGGVAICFEGECFLLGQTPNQAQVKALAQWLDRQTNIVFNTSSLPSIYSPAQDFKESASGLLAIAISKGQGNYVMWFRPEEIQTVNWAGNPEKPVQIGPDGVRLSPRKSFETWKQTVALKSLRWKRCEVEAALELREVIVSIVLRQTLEVAKLNVELERSNIELDAFAYIASHDLKEPLRGIHNYSNILLESYADRLDEDGTSKLHTLVRLTQRMEDLIESLLYYSRVGRVDLSFKPTNLQEMLDQVLDTLQPRLEEVQMKVRIPRPLPVMKCDRVRVGEIFTNLISNAIKYNDKPFKWVEIGFLNPQPQPTSTNINETVTEMHTPIIFYVRDNGIGIREKHFETIFRIFKRLHARDDFGGGTGAGLTIVKKIIERHGGYIRVDSRLGEGTTFNFTLQG